MGRLLLFSVRKKLIDARFQLLRVFQFALPDSQDTPTKFPQLLPCTAVARDVCAKLLLPKRHSSFWRCGIAASQMAMPEAAVYEDDLATGREHQIRLAGQAGNMKPITISKRMNYPPHRQLGSRVL